MDYALLTPEYLTYYLYSLRKIKKPKLPSVPDQCALYYNNGKNIIRKSWTNKEEIDLFYLRKEGIDFCKTIKLIPGRTNYICIKRYAYIINNH